MINTSISFGAWLKQRRKSLDLTQAELAHRISCTTSSLSIVSATLTTLRCTSGSIGSRGAASSKSRIVSTPVSFPSRCLTYR